MELEPHLRKRKPKPANEVVQKLAACEWTGGDAKSVKDLERLVGKYWFKEAQTVVVDILKRLGKDGNRAAEAEGDPP